MISSKSCGNIVIEGVDGTGKTTLARMLLEEIPGVRIFHQGNRPLDRQDVLQRLAMARMVARSGGLIFDRHTAISEHVYANFGGCQFDDILRELQACRVLAVIHCTVDHVDQLRMVSSGGLDDEATAWARDHAADLLHSYDVLTSDLGRYMPVYEYRPGDDVAAILRAARGILS